jgi:hypothetical protein
VALTAAGRLLAAHGECIAAQLRQAERDLAGSPGTACDYALRRLAAEADTALAAGDVCVEFPSVLALVSARPRRVR